MSHISQRVKDEGPYMEDLSSTVFSCVCAIATLKQIISGEELDHYKILSNLVC